MPTLTGVAAWWRGCRYALGQGKGCIDIEVSAAHTLSAPPSFPAFRLRSHLAPPPILAPVSPSPAPPPPLLLPSPPSCTCPYVQVVGGAFEYTHLGSFAERELADGNRRSFHRSSLQLVWTGPKVRACVRACVRLCVSACVRVRA